MASRLQRFRILLLVTMALGALVVAGCGDDEDDSGGEAQAQQKAKIPDVPFESPEKDLPTDYPDPKQEDLTIGVLNPLRSSEVVKLVMDATVQQIEDLGGEAIELDAKQIPDLQVTQLQQLINQKVDAIAMVPIAGPDLLGPLLAKAEKAGIPVIGVDVSPGKPGKVPGFTSQVSQQHDLRTYLQAKAAAEDLGPGAKVGQIGYAVAVPIFEFSEPRTKYWAEKFGLEVVDKVESPQDTVEAGQKAADALLAKNPDIEGVLGYTDPPAIGAALAARAAGRDVKTYGINGTPLGQAALENGRMTGTVYYHPEDVGRTLARGAYDAAQGTKIPPVVNVGDPMMILRKDNLDEVSK